MSCLTVLPRRPPLQREEQGLLGAQIQGGTILWWYIEGHLGLCPLVPQSVTLHQSELSVCLY